MYIPSKVDYSKLWSSRKSSINNGLEKMKNKVKASFAIKFLKPKKPLTPIAQEITVERIVVERKNVVPSPEKKSQIIVVKIDEQEEIEEPYSDFLIIESEDLSPFTTEEWKQILARKKIPEHGQLYLSLQTGVNKQLRRRIWQYLANIDELKAEYKDVNYEVLKQKDCRVKDQIKRDVVRTLPESEFFLKNENTGSEMLFNLLNAYANFDTEIGYTQGMNYLAATLIYHMNLQKFEKDYHVIDKELESDAFWIMVYILKKKGWNEVYRDGTPGLVKMLRELELRIAKEIPKLVPILDDMTINACMSQCFLTVLCYHTPRCFSKRLFDLFLLDGEEIIYDVVIKLLKNCETEILEMETPDRLFKFLRHEVVEYSYQKLERNFSKLTKDVADL